VIGSCAGRRRLIRRASSARAARDALGTARDAEAEAAAGNLILDRAQARDSRRTLRKEDDAREPGNDVQVGERLRGERLARININRCSLRLVSLNSDVRRGRRVRAGRPSRARASSKRRRRRPPMLSSRLQRRPCAAPRSRCPYAASSWREGVSVKSAQPETGNSKPHALDVVDDRVDDELCEGQRLASVGSGTEQCSAAQRTLFEEASRRRVFLGLLAETDQRLLPEPDPLAGKAALLCDELVWRARAQQEEVGVG